MLEWIIVKYVFFYRKKKLGYNYFFKCTSVEIDFVFCMLINYCVFACKG